MNEQIAGLREGFERAYRQTDLYAPGITEAAQGLYQRMARVAAEELVLGMALEHAAVIDAPQRDSLEQHLRRFVRHGLDKAIDQANTDDVQLAQFWDKADALYEESTDRIDGVTAALAEKHA